MKRQREAVIAVVALAALSACGGDGGSGSGGSTTSPPPVFTNPSPSPAYADASDFTKDRRFTAIGTTATLTYAPDGRGGLYTYDASLDPEAQAIGFDFTSSARFYRARYGDDLLNLATASVFLGPNPYDEYAEQVDPATAIGLYFARTPFKPGLKYSGLVLWRLSQRQATQPGATFRIHRMLFGARTVASDIPASGSSTYMTLAEMSDSEGPDITIPRIGTVRSSTSQMTIDWVTKTLSGIVRVLPPSATGSTLQEPTVYTISGTLAADGHIVGTINGNVFFGPVDGNIYGPAGAEIGIMFTYSGNRGSPGVRATFTGAVLGSR